MKWYYAKNGSQQGPLPTEDMKSRISMGEISQTDLAWCEGMADWMPVSEIAELKVQPPVRDEAPSSDEAPPVPSSSTPSPYQSPGSPASAATPMPVQPGQVPSQGMAIGSMVCGILGFVGCCLGFLSAPLALVAIVLGVVSLSKIKADPQRYAGAGMARTGVIVGSLGLIASLVVGGLGLWVSTLSPEEIEEKIIKFVPEEQRQEFRDKLEEARKQQQR